VAEVRSPDWVVAQADGWVAPKGLTPDGRVLAGQGRRVLGFLLDLAIWTVPQMLVFGALFAAVITLPSDEGEVSGGAILTFVLLYLLAFAIGIMRLAVEAELVFRGGQTWGMRALRLRAVDGRNGGQLSRGRSWGRAAFAVWISAQLLGFGYWWAFFDDRRRTLHDLVCNVVVIDERQA